MTLLSEKNGLFEGSLLLNTVCFLHNIYVSELFRVKMLPIVSDQLLIPLVVDGLKTPWNTGHVALELKCQACLAVLENDLVFLIILGVKLQRVLQLDKGAELTIKVF